ncbi:LPS-assembly protein LptD [Pseudomonas sp. NW5]|uniref:LPS-assembly protein LptD n=1 Tax=Pseudomonas sp. NW5 TaxID=2934934 RepID=UPI0020224A76|nr:LPS-assembly protein LptD [Pseudomonas sp. NW5]MCL7463041.1 LPS-assembly protein LptD [Pseudomonas sp. NW5]
MALNPPLFRRKFPLLVTGSLLALVAAPQLLAAEQFDCKIGSDGGWACAPRTSSVALPPRPQVSGSAQRVERPAAATARTTAPEPSSTRAAPVASSARTDSPAPAARSTDYSHLDWVPRERLNAEQLAEIAPYCAGSYVEPERPGLDERTPADQSPTFVSARVSRYDQQREVATLAGDVVLRQGSLQAQADEVSLDQPSNRGTLSGNVRLRDKGFLVVGDSAYVQLDSGEAKIDNAEYVVHSARARGEALYVKREEDAVIRLKDGTYTRCEPGSNTWELKGNNVTLNPETGFGSATNVTLRVKDIPVFYTPYIYFPIDDRRQSGFLAPSISTSKDRGFELLTPYYFNLAPNYDATLYPRLMTERGLLMEGELRYMTPSSEGQLGAAWLNDEDDERKDQPKYRDQRYLYNLQHRGGLDSRWLTEVDYTDISDPYYFQDLNSELDVRTGIAVDQRAGLSYRGDSYTARLNVHAYEMASVTDVTPYDRLPQFTLEGGRALHASGLRLDYQGEVVRFERNLDEYAFAGTPSPDSLLTGLSRANGDRVHLQPGISLPLSTSWGYLTPAAKFAWTRYDLSLDSLGRNTLAPGQRYRSSQNRGLGIYSLDSGLYFDRDTRLFGRAARQTLEPRAFYLYVPYERQDDLPVFDTGENTFSYAALFRDNRFTGHDRIGDENRLSLGVTSRWLEDNGVERQRLSIGQALHFADRKVQLPGVDMRDTASTSPLAGEYMYRFNRDWRLSSALNWDTDSGTTRSGNLMFHYQPEATPGKVINAGYRYRNDTRRFNPRTGRFEFAGEEYKIDQTDLSTIWPLAPQWSAIARWQYDYNRSRTLEAFGGFEYDSCCWKLRLINRYWIENDEFDLTRQDEADRGIFLQIVLKGLGGVVGNKVDSFLDQGIQGYREREDQAF